MCQISADMLSVMTSAATDTMPTTVTVQHPVATMSALRTPVKTYSVTAFTSVCRITSADMKAMNEQMRQIAEKYIGKQLSKILFPGGTDIRLDDQVTEPISGRTFKLLSVDTSISFRITDVALAVEFDGA